MDKKYRVWWIPQVGADIPNFHQEVSSVAEGVLLINTLANYDLFQQEHKIKPDFSNAGGLEVFENDEWLGWEIETPDGEYFDEPEEYLEHLKQAKEDRGEVVISPNFSNVSSSFTPGKEGTPNG